MTDILSEQTEAEPRPRSRPVTIAWFGCELRSGGIVAELPALRPTGPLGRRLGAPATASFELALDGACRDWEAATQPGRSVLVGVDTTTDIPVWAGTVLVRGRGSARTSDLSCATLEAYLDRRYTGTVDAYGQDTAQIVTALLANPLLYGPPFTVDAPDTGETMTYTVADSDDRTVLSALQELMGMDGGPEWTVDTAWNAARSGFAFPVRVRRRIGVQPADPEAVFDSPGCVAAYTQSESYEQGQGATVVVARGEGEGASRLSSAVYRADTLIAGGWPQYVHRYTPATGLTDPDALDRHASQALALMSTGASVWSLEAAASAAPRLGETWGLGDTVRLAVAASPGHPAGAGIVARCWAWELDPAADRVRPILVEED